MRPLLLAAALLAAPVASAQGRLAFEAERHDFGQLGEGSVATHAFRFTNTGDAPLTLAEVEAACGCTTPSFTTEAVGPGETGVVEVAYDSEGRPGPFERTVRVVASGAEPHALTLRIAGTVLPAFVPTGAPLGALTFERQTVDVGAVAAGASVQEAVQFYNAGDRPVRIERVEASVPGVDAVFPDRPVFPGTVAGLMVLTDEAGALAGAAGGPFTVTLDVHTTDAEEPVKRLVLTGTVEG